MAETVCGGGPHGRFGAAQEGIGVEFDADGGGDCGAARSTGSGHALAAPLDGDAVWLDSQGEAQVALGVFVGTVNGSRRRQHGEPGE